MLDQETFFSQEKLTTLVNKSLSLSLCISTRLQLVFMRPVMAGVQTVMECQDEGSVIIIIIHDLDA